MKVAVLPSWYYNLSSSKISGSFFKSQSIEIMNLGVDVTMLSVDLNVRRTALKKPWTLLYPIKYAFEDIPTYRVVGINLAYYWPKLMRKLWIYHFVRLVEYFIKKNGKPEIIHAHSYWGGYVASLIHKKHNIPYILTEHFSGILMKTHPHWHTPFIKQAYNDADILISVSKALKESMFYYTENKVIDVIPNFIDTAYFSPTKKIEATRIISTVGRLIPDKNIRLLIQAFIQSEAYENNWELHIAGEGSERDVLEAYIEKYDSKKLIKFLGAQNSNEIKILLNKSELFVLPSKYETFSVVIIEALSMGLPVIATRCGGPNELIHEKNGVLINPNSEAELIQAINLMTENIKLYDAKDIREETVNKFNSKVLSNQYVNLYKNVIAS